MAVAITINPNATFASQLGGITVRLDSTNAWTGVNSWSGVSSFTGASGLSVTGPLNVLGGINGDDGSFRNVLDNGDFTVAQRGVTGALSGTTGTYPSLDCWSAYSNNVSATGTLSQVAGGPVGRYYASLARTVGNAVAAQYVIGQVCDSFRSVALAGRVALLSFWGKAGATYSGGSLTIRVESGTGIDQSYYNMILSQWTGQTELLSASQAITTTWTRYTFPITVPANCTQLGFRIFFNSSGTAGMDDSLNLAGVQLEPGSIATDFEFLPPALQLANCKRRYQIVAVKLLAGAANINSFGGAYSRTALPITMRATPTATITALDNGSGWVGSTTVLNSSLNPNYCDFWAAAVQTSAGAYNNIQVTLSADL